METKSEIILMGGDFDRLYGKTMKEINEIREAIDFQTGEKGVYEIGKHCTWEEREEQVKSGKHEKVFYINNGKPEVTTWFSVCKSKWMRCRKIIRKIETEKSCGICGFYCDNMHHYNNFTDVMSASLRGVQIKKKS